MSSAVGDEPFFFALSAACFHRFMALINQMRIGIRAGVAIQLFMLFDDDQNGFLDSRLIYRGK